MACNLKTLPTQITVYALKLGQNQQNIFLNVSKVWLISQNKRLSTTWILLGVSFMSWANLVKKEGFFTITESSWETFGLYLWGNFGTKEPVGQIETGGNWWDLPKEYQEPAFWSVKTYVLRKQNYLDSSEIDIALYVFFLPLLSSLTKTKFLTILYFFVMALCWH